MNDIINWLDAEGTPEAHAARDLIESLRAELESLRTLLESKMDEVAALKQAYAEEVGYNNALRKQVDELQKEFEK